MFVVGPKLSGVYTVSAMVIFHPPSNLLQTPSPCSSRAASELMRTAPQTPEPQTPEPMIINDDDGLGNTTIRPPSRLSVAGSWTTVHSDPEREENESSTKRRRTILQEEAEPELLPQAKQLPQCRQHQVQGLWKSCRVTKRLLDEVYAKEKLALQFSALKASIQSGNNFVSRADYDDIVSATVKLRADRS